MLKTDSEKRTVSLSRDGKGQTVCIPKEFELNGEEAVMTVSKKGSRLVLEVAEKDHDDDKLSFQDLMDKWVEEDRHLGPVGFPDIEDAPASSAGCFDGMSGEDLSKI